MRVILFAAVFAMSSVGMAARADTITQNYTANGTVVLNGTGLYSVTSSSFSQFNPSLGTLNDITLNLSGVAMSSGTTLWSFSGVGTADNPHEIDVAGVGTGSGSSASRFSANGTRDTNNADLTSFEGNGTQSLLLQFLLGNGSSLTTSGTSGTLVYDYTPAASAVPEPSSVALLSTGVVCVGAAVRRRLA